MINYKTNIYLMSANELLNTKTDNQKVIKKNSASLRFWHWANFIVITGSLLTVLLNRTVTGGRSTRPFFKETLEKAGAKITDDQAKQLAHDFSDKIWDIHTDFGYFLAGLFLFRILLEFFQIADQKLIRKLKAAYSHFKTVKEQRQAALHTLSVNITYLVFYILLLIMVVTGLFLAFEDAMEPYKAIRHSVKEVHGFVMYLILAFTTAHLIGVFLAEHRKDGKGIVSDMINGGE